MILVKICCYHIHARTHTCTHTHTHTHTHRLLKLMREMFGPQNANWSREDQEKIEICVDSNTALLDPATLVSFMLQVDSPTYVQFVS